MEYKSMETVSIFANTIDEAWFSAIDGLFRLQEQVLKSLLTHNPWWTGCSVLATQISRGISDLP